MSLPPTPMIPATLAAPAKTAPTGKYTENCRLSQASTLFHAECRCDSFAQHVRARTKALEQLCRRAEVGWCVRGAAGSVLSEGDSEEALEKRELQ
jgi:hypothetical protein